MRVVLVLIALLLIAAVTWHLAGSDPLIDIARETDATRDDEPDLYGTDIELTQFNADGSLHYHLIAATIRQYKVSETTRLTAPNVHLTNPERPPWDVQSKQGYIRKRPNPQGVPEDVVYLREDVRMIQSHPQHGLITIRSEAFHIFPDRQYAETDQDVMIDTNVGRSTAGGLRVNLESGRLQLSSSPDKRVHTIVLPEQFKKT
jgi:lipopolysaccharide export system protein LptC